MVVVCWFAAVKGYTAQRLGGFPDLLSGVTGFSWEFWKLGERCFHK